MGNEARDKLQVGVLLGGMTPSTVLFHQAAASGIDRTAFIERVIQRSRDDAHAAKRGSL